MSKKEIALTIFTLALIVFLEVKCASKIKYEHSETYQFQKIIETTYAKNFNAR